MYVIPVRKSEFLMPCIAFTGLEPEDADSASVENIGNTQGEARTVTDIETLAMT